MKKKLLLLLVFCLAAVMLMAATSAPESGETLSATDENGIVWTYDTAKKELTIGLAEGNTGTTVEVYADELIAEYHIDLSEVESIVVSEGITEIDDRVFAFTFSFRPDLTSVTLPVTLEKIGNNNFSVYSNLKTVNYAGDNEQWNKVVIGTGNEFLLGVKPQAKNGELSNGITWRLDNNGVLTITGDGIINEAPWTGRYGEGYVIKSVKFEGDITGFCDGAFAFCRNLRSIELPDNITTIEDEMFASCYSLETIDIPDSVTRIEFGAFSGCSSLIKVKIPDGVTYIGEEAFQTCAALKEVDLPDNLEELGAYAFRWCVSLKALDIPGVENIETMSSASGSNLTAFETITLNEGTRTIGNLAFSSCYNLREIHLPSTLETIGLNAFGGCRLLERVSYAGDIEDWEDVEISDGNDYLLAAMPFGSFDGISYVLNLETGSLTVDGSGELTATVNGRIPWYGYMSQIETVSLSEGISAIPDGAFSGATQLTSIVIPSTVKVIGHEAFSGCTSLKNINVPDTVTSLGSAFSGCTSLESVTLSKRLSSIEGATFQNCSSLKTITLPDAVTSIGANAFDGCTSLTSVTTGDFINTVGASAFDNCPRLTLHVYDGSYMQAYAEAYDLDYEIIPGTEQEMTGIENITSSTGVNPETGEVCTVITITLSDGRTQKFYLDNEVNGIEDITSRPGFDPDGKPCTVVTITMTNGDVERFYVYDGKDGEDGETVVTPAFTDVPANAYYADAVAWAVANGITGGTAENTFSPDAPCTRAQVVTFLWRAMGSPEPRSAGTFTDVNASSYYAKAVRWALENGITSGTSATTFEPNAVCTRAQVVTFLMRALDGRSYGSAGFADVAASSYYADAVAWAVANGITDGTGATTFSPDTQCNRAQIVTFLYRAVA